MDVYRVRPVTRPLNAVVSVPGSKSETNRALLLAALAEGESTLRGALFSDDSRVFVESLRRLGLQVDADEAGATLTVQSPGDRIPASAAALYIGNSGTSSRFLTAYVCLGRGDYLLDGTARMRQRPIGALLAALRELGANVQAVDGNDCPPVRVQASGLEGGATVVDSSRSGQFLSALLMVSPYARKDTVLSLTGHLASPPYIDMTLVMMEEWGVNVRVEGDPSCATPMAPARFHITAGKRYLPRVYDVAPDASGASYFLAAAAVTRGTVTVRNLGHAGRQGDMRLLDVLALMGCTIRASDGDVTLTGPEVLDGIDLDLNAMSDMTMTLAAIAPFASGPVSIRNVAHIREQETDRLAATVAELRKLGARVEEQPDGLTVFPSALHGGTVQTYDDHRMAMAFAITGLMVPGVAIEDPACVAKTFPDYFERLEAACVS